MRARLVFAAATLAVVAGCRDDGSGAARSTTSGAMPLVAPSIVAATELVVGDCLGQVAVGARERTHVQSVRVVSCDHQHELEIFATFVLDAAQFETDPPGAYPGEERVVRAADEGCRTELEDLAETDSFGLIALWPSVESWQTGDRTVACAAFPADGSPFEARHLLAGA